MRRMDRYNGDEKLNTNTRLDKNQDLYQNLSSNTIYANITDVTNANAFEINNNKKTSTDSRTTREAYQQMQKYQNIEEKPKVRKELEDFNYVYQKKENKTYDINSFLEEARRNRGEKDEKDEKRKLKNNAYNVLMGLNKEKLEKYRQEKKERIRTPEEEELHELTEDLLSKTLTGEIDRETAVNLLSDLMATNILDTVEPMEDEENTISEEIEITEEKIEIETKPIEDKEKSENEEDEDTSTLIPDTKEVTASNKFESRDTDFYTRSMDLSDKDFDLSAEFNGKKLPVIVKILIALLILALIAVAAYFIYQRM